MVSLTMAVLGTIVAKPTEHKMFINAFFSHSFSNVESSLRLITPWRAESDYFICTKQS